MTAAELRAHDQQKWRQYAEDVLSGRIIAGRYIKLACERYLDWFSRKDIFFDFERMEKIESFIGNMKHFQGRFNGVRFTLLPWQRWVLANIFGWYYTDKPTKRVVEKVILFVARKNAKTALSAAILLAEMCVNKEHGSEQYIAANSRDQARIAQAFVKGYAKSLDPRRKHFRILKDRVEYPKTDSFCKTISAEAGIQDGGNPSIFLIDEFHAAQDDSVYQVLESGQAMRENPLAIIISSGGYLMEGFPFYDRIQMAHQELSGTVEFPDSSFYALYELDAGDDWNDESVYCKSNPSLGEIVQPDFLHKRMIESRKSMTTQVDFKIKNLDIFVTAKNIWLEPEVVDQSCTEFDMTRLVGEPCYGGVDLSSVGDLTSVAFCWPPNPYRDYLPDKYLLKVFTWLPQVALDGPNGRMYEAWIHMGILKMTSGNSVDYNEILNDVMQFSEHYPIVKIHYDEWNATSWTQAAVAQGLNLVPMSQTLGSFNRPTKSMEIFMKNGSLLIDGNPLVKWAFQNCELKTDSYGNVKPVKANGQVSRKIDPVIAMLEALAGFLFEQLFGASEIVALELG